MTLAILTLVWIGTAMLFYGVSPPMFRDPFNHFLGLRLVVGLTLLVGAVVMSVFLVVGLSCWVFVIGVRCSGIGNWGRNASPKPNESRGHAESGRT